jgi:hypothetical protein
MDQIADMEQVRVTKLLVMVTLAIAILQQYLLGKNQLVVEQESLVNNVQIVQHK